MSILAQTHLVAIHAVAMLQGKGLGQRDPHGEAHDGYGKGIRDQVWQKGEGGDHRREEPVDRRLV